MLCLCSVIGDLTRGLSVNESVWEPFLRRVVRLSGLFCCFLKIFNHKFKLYFPISVSLWGQSSYSSVCGWFAIRLFNGLWKDHVYQYRALNLTWICSEVLNDPFPCYSVLFYFDQPHRLHSLGTMRSPQGRLWHPRVAERPYNPVQLVELFCCPLSGCLEFFFHCFSFFFGLWFLSLVCFLWFGGEVYSSMTLVSIP